MSAPWGLLGLARRSGRLAAGHAAVERALVRGEARLVILAADASPGTRRRFQRLADAAGVPVRTWGGKDELGAALGTTPKAVLAVLDAGLAARLIGGRGEEPGMRRAEPATRTASTEAGSALRVPSSRARASRTRGES